MKFNMPVKIEKTLLQELCEQFGAALDITEERVLNNMSRNEITIALEYELRKARVRTKDKMNLTRQRIDQLNDKYLKVETSGNGELCMKLLADGEHLSMQLTELDMYMDYLGTLG